MAQHPLSSSSVYSFCHIKKKKTDGVALYCCSCHSSFWESRGTCPVSIPVSQDRQRQGKPTAWQSKGAATEPSHFKFNLCITKRLWIGWGTGRGKISKWIMLTFPHHLNVINIRIPKLGKRKKQMRRCKIDALCLSHQRIFVPDQYTPCCSADGFSHPDFPFFGWPAPPFVRTRLQICLRRSWHRAQRLWGHQTYFCLWGTELLCACLHRNSIILPISVTIKL